MTTSSFLAFLQRRRIVLTVTLALALIALPFLFVVLKPTYTATAHVLMIGNGVNGSMLPSSDMSNLTTSETVLSRVAKRFSLGSNLTDVAARVDAKVPHLSNVMPITFRDKDKERALLVANGLADETVAYYKQLSSGQFDQMIAYLSGAARRQQEKIRSIDLTLQQAAQRDTYIGSDTALEEITKRIGDLQTDRSVAYAAMVSDEAIASAQSAQPREIAGIVHQEVLAGNPYFQALRNKQAQIAAQLQFDRAQYTDRYPGLPGLQDEVSRQMAIVSAAEKAAIAGSPSSSASYAATILAKRNAMAIAAGDRAKVKAIDDDIAAEHEHLRDLAGVTVNVLRAQREAEKAAYGATISRLTDTRANQAAASSVGSLVVLDHAYDSSPPSPALGNGHHRHIYLALFDARYRVRCRHRRSDATFAGGDRKVVWHSACRKSRFTPLG